MRRIRITIQINHNITTIHLIQHCKYQINVQDNVTWKCLTIDVEEILEKPFSSLHQEISQDICTAGSTLRTVGLCAWHFQCHLDSWKCKSKMLLYFRYLQQSSRQGLQGNKEKGMIICPEATSWLYKLELLSGAKLE